MTNEERVSLLYLKLQSNKRQNISPKFDRGNTVKKKGTKGQWRGVIVGEYSASCTPVGYAVESVFEEGSVQIYPETALELWEV